MQREKADKSYECFKKLVLKEVGCRVEGQVSLRKVIKNNGIELDGLAILSEDTNVSPTIYLNYLYNEFLDYGLNAVVDKIISLYKKNKPNEAMDISFFTDADKVCRRIKMKLVNYARNKTLLEQVPHLKYLDLAILFYAETENMPDGVGTILIYNHHMKFWKFSIKELFEFARENMTNDFKMIPMLDVVYDVMPEVFTEEFLEEVKIEIGILTNTSGINGASGMLRNDILDRYMERHHAERLIIIPSSTHEVLLIPCDLETDVESFREMVQEVNEKQLSAEEVLSDNIYIYDGNEIKIIE